MHVHGPSRVPAWIDRRERHLAARVRDLVAAQVLLPGSALARLVGVLPVRIGVPDVDLRAGERRAGESSSSSVSARASGMPATVLPLLGSVRMAEQLSFSSTKCGPIVLLGVSDAQVEAASASSTPKSEATGVRPEPTSSPAPARPAAPIMLRRERERSRSMGVLLARKGDRRVRGLNRVSAALVWRPWEIPEGTLRGF